jgi:hypothetical protein
VLKCGNFSEDIVVFHSRVLQEASMPLKPAEEFVFLRHAPWVTLSKERLIAARLRGGAGEP